jgi:hypothetical protein
MGESELEALKERVRELNARIAALETPEAPTPAEPVKSRLETREVTVTQMMEPERVAPADLPAAAELKRLQEIVLGYFPKLIEGGKREEFSVAFAGSLRRVLNIGRAKEPDRTKYIAYWVEDAQLWLGARADYTRLSGGAFIAACLAAGDVPYQASDVTRGALWEVGLKDYGGRPPDLSAWRKVLHTGELLKVTKPRSPVYMPMTKQFRPFE